MLLSAAFIVRRIRVLVYSERNQLNRSIIALLFKQCLGSLKLKKKGKVVYVPMDTFHFTFNRFSYKMAAVM